jgi:hypothetical protein
MRGRRAETPLRGADVFHLVNDREMRAEGRAGNQAAFVMMLEGRVDEGVLRARVERAAAEVPELSGRVTGTWPFRARWASGALPPPPVRVTPAAGRAIVDVAAALLDEPIANGGPVAVDVVRGEAGDAVVVRVHHVLADAKALERIATWLGAGEGPDPAPVPAQRFAEPPLAGLDRRRRVALMRAYNAHVMQLGELAVASPASPRPGERRRPPAAGPTRALRIHLSAAETEAFDRRVREEARLAETAVLVLAATRAVDDLLGRRGLVPPRFVVPVPVSLDPKAGAERLLGNHVSMLMFALDREDLADDARALARLAAEQRTAVRERLDLGMVAALDFARWLPRPLYRMLERRPLHGEIGSFVLSNPGALRAGAFLGRPIVDALPLPAVVSSPGLQVIASRFDARLSVTLVFLDDVLAPAEAGRLHDLLRDELVRARSTAASSPRAPTAD